MALSETASTITTPSGGYDMLPDVVAYGSGFFAAWNRTEAAIKTGVWAQQFRADGTAIGQPIRIEAPAVGIVGTPQLLPVAGGKVAVFWVSAGGMLKGGLINPATRSLSGVRTIGKPGDSIHDVALLKSGKIALVMSMSTGSTPATLREKPSLFVLDAQLRTVSGPTPVVSNGFAMDAENSFDHTVVALANGGGVMLYKDRTNSQLHARVFNASGAFVGAARRVNDTAMSFPYTMERMAFHVKATALDNGKVVVTWTSRETTGFEIRARLLDATGKPIGRDFLVNTSTAGNQHFPEIVKLGGGKFAVTWAEDASYARRNMVRFFDASGQPLSGALMTENTGFGTAEDMESVRIGNDIATIWSSFPFASGLKGDLYRQPRFGTAAGETVSSTAGDDTALLGAGNDTFHAGAGSDLLDGGVGNDTYSAAKLTKAAYGQTVSLLFQTDHFNVTKSNGGYDSISGFETFVLSAFDDSFSGGASTQAYTVDGGRGNDIIQGGWSNDALYGGAGDDILHGNGGNDRLFGGDGADYLAVSTGQGLIDGGSGNDFMMVGLSGAQTFNIATGAFSVAGASHSLTIRSIEGIRTWGTYDDTITGSGGDNYIEVSTGKDKVSAGAGNDTVMVLDGNDTLDGGTGNDTLAFSGYGVTMANAVTIDLGARSIGGGAAGTTFTNFENVVGTNSWNGNDTITGDNAANVLSGMSGADSLTGLGGNDRLLGGDGNDTLSGGTGNDVLIGGYGDDVMSGGTGNDTFVIAQYDGNDRITDLATGDKVDLRAFGFSGYAAVKSRLKDTGSDVELALSVGQKIVFSGVASVGSLGAAKFTLA